MSEKRVPIYIRVSSAEQVEGTSLTTQMEQCKMAAEREGFLPGQVFSDEGESAKTTDRPEFLRLLDYIKKNQPPALVVWKLDRLARNSLDSQIFRHMLKEQQCRLISATERITEDISGKLLADVMSAIAEYDNAQRTERVKLGMLTRAKEGCWTATPPLGYVTARTKENKPSLKLDPEKAPLVTKLFQLVASGNTQVEALELINTMGLTTRKGNPVSPQTVSRMLSNHVYVGLLKNDRVSPVPIKGNWVPLVSQDVFDRVQLALHKGKSTARNSDDFPLRGLLACDSCGHPLTASYSQGTGGRYAYYHCYQCRKVRTGREETEIAVQACIERLAVEPEMVKVMEEILNRYVKRLLEPTNKNKDRCQKRLTRLDAKLDRLIEMRMDGQIDKERYKKKYARV